MEETTLDCITAPKNGQTEILYNFFNTNALAELTGFGPRGPCLYLGINYLQDTIYSLIFPNRHSGPRLYRQAARSISPVQGAKILPRGGLNRLKFHHYTGVVPLA